VSERARAFWVRKPGAGEIREVPLREPGPDDVVVRTLHSGISRGTETLVFRGEVPESQREAMRAPFQEGDFPGPVEYGYLAVGVVGRGPAELRGRTVVELSWYGDREVTVSLGGAFHSRRASQVGTVAPARRGARSIRDGLALALDLLRDPPFDALLTGSSRFGELPVWR
jgi:NADPH:quinone reductase-like Zn-dependent oxidoreductase